MRIATVLAAAGALTMATVASADFLAIELDFEFSGATAPSGAGPWLKAEFSSSTPGEVSLKLISQLNGSTEKVSNWSFNFDTSLNPDGLNISQDSGPAASWTTGVDHYKANGNGYYDLRFAFPTSGNLFKQGSVAEFTITSTDPINASSFAYLSVGGSPEKTGFMSAAHVLGIGDDSGWIAPGTPGQVLVPLPAPVMLGGAGLMLAAGVSVWRRRR